MRHIINYVQPVTKSESLKSSEKEKHTVKKNMRMLGPRFYLQQQTITTTENMRQLSPETMRATQHL
jgi:hypothetical protein